MPPASQLVESTLIENSPPEIAGTPPAAVQAGEVYSFMPVASDADGDFLEFTVTNKPAWAQFSVETGRLTGTPDDASVGETEDIVISVTDGRDTRSVGPFKIRIHSRNLPPSPAVNAAPVISGVPSGSVLVNQAYLFQPVATDADGDRLSFSISNRPSWASFSTSTGRLSGTPGVNRAGRYANITISVSDGKAGTALAPFSIEVRSDNRAPTISGTPAAAVQAGQAYSFQPSANDPDGDTLTYSISNRPSWAAFSSSTGRLSGTPSAGEVGNYANIVIGVSDGRASAMLSAFSIVVQEKPNAAPKISGTPPGSIDVGAAYSFVPSASDADKDTLGFSIQNKPVWANFDTATGRLSGSPADSHVGATTGIVISVSDGRATASLPAFSITVKAVENKAPIISGTPATSVNAGVAYSFRPTASDPEGDNLTYSIKRLPAWASFNTNTGRLSGTPAESDAGSYANIVISVSDGKNTTSLPAFMITVVKSSTGVATVQWTPPTENSDGTPLTDLAGFRVKYGKSASTLDQTADIENPGVATYVVEDLTSGTWYFAVLAYTSSGIESGLSNIASKTIP
ncbi:hypothetical protein ACG33_14250 [Steroidobacter denitrificans]|uniref:Fibronectin type-III domain-containing protein n=1 Tax=Steroidobacter denitrificans TaxID=465721 RepID=A0A127FCV2_STEDE|nr:hypothetical protein ACG33_14250 [Steroidobacter denitrificans]